VDSAKLNDWLQEVVNEPTAEIDDEEKNR